MVGKRKRADTAAEGEGNEANADSSVQDQLEQFHSWLADTMVVLRASVLPSTRLEIAIANLAFLIVKTHHLLPLTVQYNLPHKLRMMQSAQNFLSHQKAPQLRH